MTPNDLVALGRKHGHEYGSILEVGHILPDGHRLAAGRVWLFVFGDVSSALQDDIDWYRPAGVDVRAVSIDDLGDVVVGIVDDAYDRGYAKGSERWWTKAWQWLQGVLR